MNCSKGDANFLAQYQKLLFSEKLEKGSPSEKADILRHTISQLQFAKLSGVSSEEVVSKLLTQYQDAYSNIVDSFDEKTGQTIDAEMTSKSSHYCCWSDGPMATIAPFGILLFRIVRGVPDAIAQAIVPIEVGLSDKELSGVDRSGLNNYAEGALNLCSGHKNESQSWTSSLTVDSVLKMPGFQQLIKHVKVSKDKVLPADKRNERLPLKKETPPPNNQVNNPNPSFRTDIKSTSVPVTNQTITGIRSGPSDYRPHDGNFRQPPDERSYNRDMRPPPSDQILNLYDDKGRPQPNNAARNKGNVYMGRDYGRSDMNNENDAQYMNRKPLFGGGGRTNAQPWQNQRSQPMHGQNSDGYMGKRKMAEAPEEDDNDRPNMAGNAFRTAKQQLAMDNQRKYGGGGGQQNRSSGSLNNAAYGTGKKSLGPRRGLNSKFVPPVMNREDMDTDGNQAANTITRAVLKTGGSESSSFNYEGLDEEKLKGIEPKMIELIMNEIMDTGPELTWDDVAGLEFAKKTIKEIVVWPMLRPDIFTGLRGPPKGLLLFGPPGTGKTLIGKCIASQSKSTFFCISASSLTSKWVGEGEKMVRALFAVARAQQPAVVFIDEIDSLLTQRTDGENEASRRIKTEFLVQLDGASTNSDDRLLVIGATNRPQEIDEAARRRFVKRLYIPLPEYNARKTIIVNLLKKQSYRLEEDQLEQICTRTEGFSGADMATLCREAALGPIRDMSFGDIEHITADQVRPIQFCDFTDALDAVRPSVSDKDLDLYLDWNKTFGSGSR